MSQLGSIHQVGGRRTTSMQLSFITYEAAGYARRTSTEKVTSRWKKRRPRMVVWVVIHAEGDWEGLGRGTERVRAS